MGIPERPVLYSADLGECNALKSLEEEDIVAAFVTALKRAGATVVQTLSHTHPGIGLTSVLILNESHAVLHTWPETGTVNIDIFSCSTRLRSLEAITDLSRYLGADEMSIQQIPRADGVSLDRQRVRA